MDFITANLGADIAGETIVPHFDLVAMGLPTAEVGSEVIAECDTAAIKEAMKKGIIFISFNVDLGAGVPLPAVGVLTCFASEAANAYQGSVLLFMNGLPLLITVEARPSSIAFSSVMLGG